MARYGSAGVKSLCRKDGQNNAMKMLAFFGRKTGNSIPLEILEL